MKRAWIAGALVALAPWIASAAGIMPLHQIAIRLSDLRAGYVQGTGLGCDGYRKASGVGLEENVSVHQLYREGWLNSYGACFSHGRSAITEELALFANPAGATWFYRVSVGTMTCCGAVYRPQPAPASFAQQRTVYMDVSQAGGMQGVIFREGTYVVEIDLAPKHDRAALLALARLVDGRMRRSG